MKHTVTTENENEFKLMAHHLDAYRMIDCLESDLYNELQKYSNGTEVGDELIMEGLVIARRIYQDNLDQFGLEGVYNQEMEVGE